MSKYAKKKSGEWSKARVAARFELSGKPTIAERARQLLREDAKWKPILEECLFAAKRDKKTGKFAGAWVMQGLRAQRIDPPNNLRTLAALGLLKQVAITRGGNRAYYTIVDQKAIRRTLDEFHS